MTSLHRPLPTAMASIALSALLLPLILPACAGEVGGRPSAVPASSAAKNQATGSAPTAPRATTEPTETKTSCTVVSGGDDATFVARRNAAVDALAKGDTDEALRRTRVLLAERPGNPGLLVLNEALKKGRNDAAKKVMVYWSAQNNGLHLPSLTKLRPLSDPRTHAAAPKLTLRSDKKNQVVDDASWFKDNGIPASKLTNDEIPAVVPRRLNTTAPKELRSVTQHRDHAIALYTDKRLLIFGPDWSLIAAVDLRPLIRQLAGRIGSWFDAEVTGAQLVGTRLYFSLSHNRYARATAGDNARLFGYDLATRSLSFETKPLVACCGFVVTGNHILTGYGFTSEKDFVYVVNRFTGAIEQTLPIGTRPERFYEANNILFVRGYNRDLQFTITGGSSAPLPPAGDGLSPAMAADQLAVSPWAEGDGCELKNILVAIDAGDRTKALTAVSRLSSATFNQDFMGPVGDAANRPPAMTLDVAVRSLPRPPFAAVDHHQHPKLKPGKPARLTRLPGGGKRRASGEWDRAMKNYPALNFAPIDAGGPTGAFPGWFGTLPLRSAITHSNHHALIFGDTAVVVAKNGKATHAFDFASFLKAPAIDAPVGMRRFSDQFVTWAEAADGVLYVANGGGTYAKEVRGKKGFVTAIDLASGNLLWRSSPLVSNANLIVLPRTIITGYGFTAEPDFIYVLDRETGRTLARHTVASGPEKLVLVGDTLYVRTYDSELKFRVAH